MKKKPTEEKVQLVPIDLIRVINPRSRDRKKHQQIIESIASIGLKKPIKVSRRSESDESGYDLVYGQGRLEAFVSLGAKEIPALVVDASREDRLLMSLVENMARRHPMPAALLKEIQRLKALGHSNIAIGKKIGISDTNVGGFLALASAGEERLLAATLAGKIPLGVAMEIARTDTVEAQRELLKAYETNRLPSQASIRVVKRLIEQRRLLGAESSSAAGTARKRPSVDSLVLAYRQDVEKRKTMVQKANVAEKRLIFIVTALQQLLADENFVNLLRAENLRTMPEYLTAQMKQPRLHAHAA